MFLDSISKLGLLKHDPETNVLLPFPHDVRRGIVNYVVTFLADPSTNASAVVSSAAHMRFALECIGEGFRLPLDSAGIITLCLDVYTRWVGDAAARPSAMNAHLEQYVLHMLRQLTLLFACRAKGNSEMQAQAELCKRALQIYAAAARMDLSRAAWDDVQKLMLGVTDAVINPPTS